INFLQEQGADVLICGGLGLRAQELLTSAGIKVCGGASGNADAAVQAYLNDSLDFDPLAAEHHGPCGHCHEEA
ncbi:MAG: hypothetical protein EOM64_07800, partial [Erysipelotrichia bacterium]|nr:hypothetical protein [Erysipelotrichia bacterium]